MEFEFGQREGGGFVPTHSPLLRTLPLLEIKGSQGTDCSRPTGEELLQQCFLSSQCLLSRARKEKLRVWVTCPEPSAQLSHTAAVPPALPSRAHLAQLLGVQGDDGHGVATAGGANHELPPVSTFVEEDAGVQGRATDELLVALRGGERAPLGP